MYVKHLCPKFKRHHNNHSQHDQNSGRAYDVVPREAGHNGNRQPHACRGDDTTDANRDPLGPSQRKPTKQRGVLVTFPLRMISASGV
jgi:hypothetical protein